ncbi:hypothetical protein D0T87_21675 [Bacteroides sp. 51]|nr:hypothetical protein [Bacteroides sp. 51]
MTSPLVVINAQEIFIDTNSQKISISVGALNDSKSSLKVLEDNHLKWKSIKDIEQVDLLLGKDFLSSLFKNNLYFNMEGYEPFWQAFINDKKLIFNDMGSDTKEMFSIDIYISESDINPTFYMMFKSPDSRVFGTISYLGLNNLEQNYGLVESLSLYNVYLCKDDKTYRGCAEIELDNNPFIEGLENWGCNDYFIQYTPLSTSKDVQLMLVNMGCGDFPERYYLLSIKNNKIVSNLYVAGEWYEDFNNRESTSFDIDADYNIIVTTTWDKKDTTGSGGTRRYTILEDGKIIEMK